MEIAKIVLILLGGVLIAVGAAANEAHWLCQYMDHGSTRGGEKAAFVNDAVGWDDMPTDFHIIPLPILPADEGINSGYVLKYSPEKNEVWIFPQWTFDVTGEGSQEGTHGLCAVWIYDLSVQAGD